MIITIIIIVSEYAELRDTDMITRYSKQREALIEILKTTDCHPTADWLYNELRKQFPKVSLATVYRNLRQLTECGEIMSIDAGTGCEHYDGNFRQHYHFVCKECGTIYDIDIKPYENLDSEMRDKTGIDIHGHTLLFYGICEDCKSKK